MTNDPSLMQIGTRNNLLHISEARGADPSLTAVAVILTGIMGAIIVTPLMNRLRITDFRARGFAAGLASHGIGTARAFGRHIVANSTVSDRTLHKQGRGLRKQAY